MCGCSACASRYILSISTFLSMSTYLSQPFSLYIFPHILSTRTDLFIFFLLSSLSSLLIPFSLFLMVVCISGLESIVQHSHRIGTTAKMVRLRLYSDRSISLSFCLSVSHFLCSLIFYPWDIFTCLMLTCKSLIFALTDLHHYSHMYS